MNIVQEGISYGWIAPTLITLQTGNEFSVTTNDLSWLGSSHELGKIAGPLLATLLLDRIGRKSVLVICAILFFLSWTAICVSCSIAHICVARVCFGLSHGMSEVTASIYYGENFSPKLRAIFCSTVMVIFYAFELVEFVIASLYSYRVTAAINAGIAFIGLVSMYLCKETPQYLLMKGKIAEAEKNYSWLRGLTGTEADIEFHQIKQNVEEERRKKRSYRKLLSARANYRSLIIVSVLCSLTMATGGPAILSYVTMLFSSGDVLTPYQFAILFASIRLVVAFTIPFYVERCRRRTLIVGSLFLVTLTHLCTSALYYVQTHVVRLEYFSWYIFGTVTLYASIFTVLSSTNTMARGELFPQSIRAIGGFTAVSLLSVAAFLITKSFLFIKVQFGVQMNFLLFAVVAFGAFLYTYLQLPETRGKTLVDIQKYLEK